MYKRTFTDYIFLYLKGIAMGSANKVPGVSGGMVALVLNFYEELIYTFQKFNGKALKLLSQKRFQSFFNYINYKFLIAVFAGSFTAYFTVSLIIDFFIRYNELLVWSLFFGMVLGSIYYVSKKINTYNPQVFLIILAGAFIGLMVSFLDPMAPNEQIGFVIFCGFVSVSGMALPGFSGSFILIILGNYVLLMIDAVNNIVGIFNDMLMGNWGFLQDDHRMHLLSLIFYFTFGSLMGLILFSKMMGYLLKNYHDRVIAALLGFIIGSIGATWPWKNAVYKTDTQGDFILDSNGDKIIMTYDRYLPAIFDSDLVTAIVLIVIGFILVWLIEYFERRKKPKVKKWPTD